MIFISHKPSSEAFATALGFVRPSSSRTIQPTIGTVREVNMNVSVTSNPSSTPLFSSFAVREVSNAAVKKGYPLSTPHSFRAIAPTACCGREVNMNASVTNGNPLSTLNSSNPAVGVVREVISAAVTLAIDS